MKLFFTIFGIKNYFLYIELLCYISKIYSEDQYDSLVVVLFIVLTLSKLCYYTKLVIYLIYI